MLEAWSPVTDDFALVHARVAAAVDAYVAWMERIGRTHRRKDIATSLEDAFASLAPLSMSKRRKLFVSAGPEWTAFFQSGPDGSDPSAGGRQLSVELGVTGMRVCATPSAYLWQAVIWEVYAPAALGGDSFGVRRTLAAANDGGKWVFEQSGAPFPFERTERYGAVRKRDRFTRDMLEAYLRESAVNPYALDALEVSAATPAILLDLLGHEDDLPTFTFAEARARHRR